MKNIISDVLNELGNDIVNDMKSLIKDDLGNLKNSISYIIKDDEIIINMLEYGIFVNSGTKPHFPPIKSIEGWAKRKGINPWAVAYSISKKGTKKNNFMKKFENPDEYLKKFEEKVGIKYEDYLYSKLKNKNIK